MTHDIAHCATPYALLRIGVDDTSAKELTDALYNMIVKLKEEGVI